MQLESSKCSWVPENQRQPEIPSISTKPRNCNSKLIARKGKKWSEKMENTLRSSNWQQVLVPTIVILTAVCQVALYARTSRASKKDLLLSYL